MSKRVPTVLLAVGMILATVVVLGNDPDVRRAFTPRPAAITQVRDVAPAAVATKVNGFCSGVLELEWFDASMDVTQEQVDAYAAESHECTGVRYLGSLSVTSYTGDVGTDYIYVLTLHGKETWWVFTVTSAGLIADIQ